MPCPRVSREFGLASVFALLVLITRSTVFIFTPLYLDALTPTDAPILNISGPNSSDQILVSNETVYPAYQQIDPLCAIVFSMGFDTVVLGTMLLIIKFFFPGRITDRETKYPKKGFLIAGGSQGMSSLIFLYACSGARTAPYLQAVLGNFHIPITFTLRFFILRKRPTLRKLLCASVVAGAEMVTLIPTIFPSLESSGDRNREGGATGVGRILWPFCFVASMLPAAISNIAQEVIYKAEQGKKKEEGPAEDKDPPASHAKDRINMIYALFWTYFCIFTTCVLCFWTDLIPGFGTSSNITLFGQLVAFNFGCIFGAHEVCSWPVWFLAWGRMVSKTLNVLVSAFLLRYGEGANFLVIILAMRTPVVFLFWTMFDEHPFHWNPQTHLSTWLSIGAIFIMVPAMIIYQTGAPERTIPKNTTREISSDSVEKEDIPEDQRPLLLPGASPSIQNYDSIDARHSQSS